MINDFNKFDALADVLAKDFQPEKLPKLFDKPDLAQIRAVAYETLAMMPVDQYACRCSTIRFIMKSRISLLEQQAFEFDNQDAQIILDQLDLDETDDF